MTLDDLDKQTAACAEQASAAYVLGGERAARAVIAVCFPWPTKPASRRARVVVAKRRGAAWDKVADFLPKLKGDGSWTVPGTYAKVTYGTRPAR